MAAAKAVVAAVTAVVLVVALPPPAAHAALYKVGDAAGWTTIGNVDYKQWAAPKTFHVGDVIVFNYAPQFHNVMQVTHRDYKACNASFPIATHTSGNDSITITKHGHHFFLCGVPGHCQSGQKVDINVRRTATTTASAMAPSPSHESVASSAPAKPAASAWLLALQVMLLLVLLLWSAFSSVQSLLLWLLFYLFNSLVLLIFECGFLAYRVFVDDALADDIK